MPQLNDLSRSLVALDQDSTIIAVVELSQSSRTCRMRSSVSSEPPSRRRRMPRSSLFFRPALIFAALLLGAGIALRDVPSAAESARSVPTPVLDTPANPQATSEVAILAGGCF